MENAFALSHTVFLFLFLERLSKFAQYIQLVYQGLPEILQNHIKSEKECYNRDRKISLI